jgi:hypothetical protein
MFLPHWKVENCDNPDKASTVGYVRVPPSVEPMCSSDAGESWKYYGNDAENQGIKVECSGN